MAKVHVAETGIEGLRETTQMNALASFDFFCNHVLGLCIDSSVCEKLQAALDASTHARVLTKQPKTVSGAITFWLRLQGYAVVGAVVGVEASERLGETFEWIFGGYEAEEQPHLAWVVKAKDGAVVLLCSDARRLSLAA